MTDKLEPGGCARRSLMRRALGASVVVLISTRAFVVAAAENAGVVINNFTFSPTPLTVKAGTTVNWVNRDDMPHSIVLPALKVKSHPMDTDEDFAYRFEQAGTYDYLCGLHPHMHGQALVQA
jgi:plastocyanin